MEATACQASCRLVIKKRLEVRSEWGKRRCLTCLSAAYKTWSSTSRPIHNPSCNQIIEGISVRFLTSSRNSCMKMASMASAAKKCRFLAKASTFGLTSLRTWAVKASRAASRSKAKASIHGGMLRLLSVTCFRARAAPLLMIRMGSILTSFNSSGSATCSPPQVAFSLSLKKISRREGNRSC